MIVTLNTYDWAKAFEYAGESVEGQEHPQWGYPMSQDGYANVTPVEGSGVAPLPFTREDVTRIIAIEAGENDGPDWIGVFELRDGRFAFLTAGCDYTGWECRSSGQAWVADDLERLIQFGLSDNARDRLASQLAAIGSDTAQEPDTTDHPTGRESRDREE